MQQFLDLISTGRWRIWALVAVSALTSGLTAAGYPQAASTILGIATAAGLAVHQLDKKDHADQPADAAK